MFTARGKNKTGIKNNITIYIMPSEKSNVMFMYFLVDNAKTNHIDKANIFTDFSAIVLE